ncbi:MAG: hypothetical protein R3C10_16045 [Pirellulales bacterium]
MKYKLPILTIAVLLAAGWAGWRARHSENRVDDELAAVQEVAILGQVAPTQGPDAASDGASSATAASDYGAGRATAVLHESIQMIETCPSLHCRVRHRGRLYGEELKGSGEYVQGPSRLHQFRLDLSLRAGDLAARLVQVCDGRSMWTYRLIDDAPALSHVDLRRVQDLTKPSDGQATWYPWRDMSGIGGMPHLLRGLDETFQFVRVSPGTLDGSPVWSLRGAWRPEPLKRLLGGQAATIDDGGEIDWSELSPHAPDHVVVVTGRDDRLPYRIEYRRSEGIAGTIAAPCATADDDTEMLLVMEFFRVRLGEEAAPGTFDYDPGNLPPSDHTERYITALRDSAPRRSSVGPALR